LSALLIAEAAGGDGGLAQPGPEQHMPYWATPWASGMALAEAVLSDPGPFRGRRSLELGCGLGVTAIAAAQATAHLTVADCFAEALAYCRLNVMQNAGADVHSLLADWLLPAGRALLERAGPFDVILAADVLYEPADVEPLLRMVPRLLRRDGVFWLAEPGRATSAAFVTAAQHEGWREMGSAVYQRDWPAGAGRARVVVRRYSTT